MHPNPNPNPNPKQEVAVHHACAASPIDGLVKFIGYGFSEDGRTPEVRGFIVMEMLTLTLTLTLTPNP